MRFKIAMAAIVALFSNAMAQTGASYTESLSGVSGKTLDMVLVEGGEFTMGCSTGDNVCESTEKPAHKVTLSNYYIGKYEVTNSQWQAVMNDGTTKDNKPKTSITWYDAVTFTCEISKKTGKKYRLLTDAEFEYAARGGKSTKGYLYSGSNSADEVAWHSGNVTKQCFNGTCFGSAQDVGGKKANELGLYDMSGNVYEWTHDSWGNYPSDGAAATNPVNTPAKHTQKVRRGGSHDQPASESRVSARKIRSIEGKDGSIGFRLAVSASGTNPPIAQINPCDIHEPPPTGGAISFRDERLVTADDEVWLYDMSSYSGQPMAYALKISANGTARYALIMNGNVTEYGATASGDWYTLNNYSLYLTPASGTAKKYIYYVISSDNMAMMPDGESPGRYERVKISQYTGANKVTLPTSSKTLAQLTQGKQNADMANLPTTGRDSRLIDGPNSAWLQDNVAMGAGGTHRYRKDFDNESSMRFVVWDAPNSTLLANGPWFTFDNTFLRVNDKNGQIYDYLYSVSSDGKKFYHISFQSYEKGDFRMFDKVSSSTNCTNTRDNITCVQGWIEPAANATTMNQGGSTYIPPSNNPVVTSSSSRASSSSSTISSPSGGSSSSAISSSSGGPSSSVGSSSSVGGSSSSEEGDNTAILSQIAVSNQVMKIKNGIGLHAVNGAIVEIYSMKGKLINRQNYSSGIYSVSFSNLPKGMYIVKVRFDKGAKMLRVPVM